MSESKIGTSVQHYRIVAKLGAGGMGEVYLAEDTNLERRVALKIILSGLAGDETRVRRFVQEAKAASALNHPNILTVHEIGEFDSSRYIVTEYIKGQTLRDRLSNGTPSLRETLEVTMQVAAALSAAHNAGIVHRDIKPENIMIRDDGIVKILDFGLVKLTEKKRELADSGDATRVKTDPGMVMGTAAYMSPEQARGKETDARTDVWSLGVVLYEMLSGESPFAGETSNDSIASILTKDPAPLPAEVPYELHKFVRRALQKKPDERYQTVKDFLLDLQDLKRELEVSEEIERSQIPSSLRSTNVGITASNENVTAMHPATLSTHDTLSHQPSSAEYIVSEIKQHKRGLLAVLGVLLAAFIGAGAYFYWFASPAKAAITSVAVLPFTNASGDAEQEYLSDGISEAVINNLSQLKDLKVIARSSTFQYKGKDINLDEVAKTLGVEAVVTGRVVKRGDQLQISAELVKVSDKSQLWGETFNRMASETGGIEAELSKQIAERLKQRLTNAEQQQLAKGANISPQAHDLYLRAIFTYTKSSGDRKEKSQKAIDLLNQAIALEPNYALAYSGIAKVTIFLMGNGLVDPKLGKPKVEAALKKALELDDSLPEVYAEIGRFQTINWNWAEAERAYKQALDLNPNLARVHAAYSSLLDVLGRHDDSIVHMRKAVDLDPAVLGNRVNLSLSLYFARRYDESIDLMKKTLELDPDRSAGHSYMGYAYSAKGQYDQAIPEFKEAMRIDGVNSSDQCYLGSALARVGRRDEALTILRELENSKEYVSPAELAVLYIGLDDKEKAFAELEKAFAARDLQLQYLGVDPNFDDLRQDPRFADLLRRVGLAK